MLQDASFLKHTLIKDKLQEGREMFNLPPIFKKT